MVILNKLVVVVFCHQVITCWQLWVLLGTVVWLDLLIRYCRASPLPLLFSSALVSTAYSQEHLKTITLQKFGCKPSVIMGNSKNYLCSIRQKWSLDGVESKSLCSPCGKLGSTIASAVETTQPMKTLEICCGCISVSIHVLRKIVYFSFTKRPH